MYMSRPLGLYFCAYNTDISIFTCLHVLLVMDAKYVPARRINFTNQTSFIRGHFREKKLVYIQRRRSGGGGGVAGGQSPPTKILGWQTYHFASHPKKKKKKN